MSVREIPPGEWQGFLDDFSRRHRAWLASVDRLAPDAGTHVEVFERPLGSIVADRAARGMGSIRIEFQHDAHAERGVRIESPARLRVDETEGGAARSLEIEDASGDRIRVRLRVASPPGLLDGMAPGEL